MKLIAVHVAKLGIMSSISVLLLAEVGALGLPGGWVLVSLLLNVYWFGWQTHAFLGSLVEGLNPPDENSSPSYVRFYNQSHVVMHRSPKTKDLLKMVTRTN